MRVSLIVAMGSNGVIGVDDGLPWHLPEDLANFKALTLGHPMIMGRTTYDSIGRPLPGRTSIVVTRQSDWDAGHDAVLVAHSVDEAFALAEELDDEVALIGGAQLYAAALDRVDRMVVTHVDDAPTGDTVFPDVDWSRWKAIAESAGEGPPPFRIVTYDRA